MLDLKRRAPVEDDLIFFAMPYGEKELPTGQTENFDDLYLGYFVDWVERWGFRAHRADKMAGSTESAIDAAWDGIDKAGVIVVDLSCPSTSVAMELGWALCLKKRLVVIGHKGATVPANVDKQFRFIEYEWNTRGLPQLRDSLEVEINAARKSLTPEMDLVPRRSDRVSARVKIEEVYEDHYRVRDVNHPRRSAELYKSDVSYHEVLSAEGMPTRFRPGIPIEGVFVYKDDVQLFSQRDQEDNPWPLWEATYQRGHTYTARVSEVNNGGVFIVLPEGGKSRIPTHQATGLRVGDEVGVGVRRIDRELQRIEVARTDQVTVPVPPMSPEAAYPKSGERMGATVRVVRPDRGYVLVDLDGHQNLAKPAMLHVSMMTEGLRQSVSAGMISMGHRVFVEVREVSPDRNSPGQWKVQVIEILKDESVSAVEGPARTLECAGEEGAVT